MVSNLTATYLLKRYLHYYLFGVHLGVKNLLVNGFSLGFRKTIGKIFQPINSFCRYPEYECFFQAITNVLAPGRQHRILDIGSPKLFGLYLAYNYDVDLVLTDISMHHLTEYIQLWHCIRNNSKGNVSFKTMDARDIHYDNSLFDVVYSMSVVEHIDTKEGDKEAIGEMFRVLKKTNFLLLSVPIGSRYIEQYREEFSYLINANNRKTKYFFQRIYDRTSILKLISENRNINKINMKAVCIHRRLCHILKLYLKLGENIRGSLGFISPVIAYVFCKIHLNIEDYTDSCERYYQESRIDDIYSDIVLILQKLPG